MDNWRLEHLLELLKDDPKDEFIVYALAQEYLKIGQFNEALNMFLKLQLLNKDYVGLYYHLGGLYIALEDEERALNAYKEGIKIAQKLGDQHALSELLNAKTNLELGV